ncbi:MAG: heterodisulfide reductase-related iron-sulfur binding cluster [Desulfobacterota bacterium]|nr:heterodisulfide reductase-related iron-sulfur binding cluster [Thermodesulfobacteriota bacterium]
MAERIELDINRIENFLYELKGCVRCKGCLWVDHIYMPGVRFSTRCPSAAHFLYDAFGAYGKMRIGLGYVERRLPPSETLRHLFYACPLCGACDVGCKRNLDLEIGLALEAIRVKLVKDGLGPMPVHREIAHQIEKQGNLFGLPYEGRKGWLSRAIRLTEGAKVLYFVGCYGSYYHSEIPQATVKILEASGVPFQLMEDERCCGNLLFSVGMIEEAKREAELNLQSIRKSGATTLLTTCAECYRMWKVDYPKIFGLSTHELGFEVKHLAEFVYEGIIEGRISFSHRLEKRVAYHDSCSLSRLSEPWTRWSGERRRWGVLDPPLVRRRGTFGVYHPPREILDRIPGIHLMEFHRNRENSFCCGAGRGTLEAFPDFALWSAGQRIEEAFDLGAEAIVSACPRCKRNFLNAAKEKKGELQLLDLSEVISSAMGGGPMGVRAARCRKMIPKEASKELESIVGREYFTMDPVLCEGYRAGPRGYECGLGYEKVMARVPAAVVLPAETPEVQAIVQTCYRFQIPYVPYSTGFYGAKSAPHVEGALLIDLKRMAHFEIDEDHLMAVVGPGIVYSQLQAEALRRGMYVLVGGGGGQVSVIANMINDGTSPHSYRFGLAQRRILGTELVLPDGEVLRLGSLSTEEDPFWGEGPGPDLRGLLRGGTGWRGSFGIVTKMALKLMPFQPEPLRPEGISPHTALRLPQERVKWVNIRMPDRESLVKAVYEIGKAEIGAAVMRVPLFWRTVARSESKEEFWKRWSEESEESIEKFHLLRVLLIGYGSEEQMAYEEKVLYDIVNELGGEIRRTKPTDESWFKNADSAGMWLMCGGYLSVEYSSDTLNHAILQGEAMADLKQGYTPPLMPDYGERGWFQSIEMGHLGYSEYLIYWDPEEVLEAADRFFLKSLEENIRNRFYTAMLGPNQPLSLTGPAYGPNYHRWLLAIKSQFDPQWLCHPPHPLAHDRFLERRGWARPKESSEGSPTGEERGREGEVDQRLTGKSERG